MTDETSKRLNCQLDQRDLVRMRLEVWDEDVARIQALAQLLASDIDAARLLREKIEEILSNEPASSVMDLCGPACMSH